MVGMTTGIGTISSILLFVLTLVAGGDDSGSSCGSSSSGDDSTWTVGTVTFCANGDEIDGRVSSSPGMVESCIIVESDADVVMSGKDG